MPIAADDMAKSMKLSEFARQEGISYGTAYKHWNQGNIEGHKLPTRTILVTGWRKDRVQDSGATRAILYARVARTKEKHHDAALEASAQIERLQQYAAQYGYTIVDRAKEIGMGLDPNRIKLLDILARTDWDVLLVTSREIPVKFSYSYLEAALVASGRRIEYLDEVDRDAENVTLDLIKNVHHLVRSLIGISRRQILDALNRVSS